MKSNEKLQDECQRQVGGQMWTEIVIPTGPQARDQVSRQVCGQVWNQICEQVWDRVGPLTITL